MLRGFTTITYFVDDVRAARRWYADMLGVEPYFERPDPDDPAYVEFRVGDYQHELGLIDSRYAPHDTATGPAGAVQYWHVDDVRASYARLLSLGAREHEAPVDREAGWVTASVVDPFGNIVGLMYSPHYLEVLGR
ncbi:VOC family protein [Prauserella cavernicola]|uniref:VOC family protein n=1 Tax=Prauserella cavernicola TaxID=2800127 RepID=A0A934QNG6_9PSEU|nr:VOC family protein [Prauserella cavernicola]MBK1783091.1 VOC family protein [Prauserella cavernicola]